MASTVLDMLCKAHRQRPSSLTALSGILILTVAESLMSPSLVPNLAVEAAGIHHSGPADPLVHLWPFVLPVAHSFFFSPLRKLFTARWPGQFARKSLFTRLIQW